jgi:hypothetical protein
VEEIMTYEELSAVVPESVKVALQNYQFHQVMSQKRWQPVHEGLQALQKLR